MSPHDRRFSPRWADLAHYRCFHRADAMEHRADGSKHRVNVRGHEQMEGDIERMVCFHRANVPGPRRNVRSQRAILCEQQGMCANSRPNSSTQRRKSSRRARGSSGPRGRPRLSKLCTLGQRFNGDASRASGSIHRARRSWSGRFVGDLATDMPAPGEPARAPRVGTASGEHVSGGLRP